MIERTSPDGRVRLVADERRIDSYVAAGLLDDTPIASVRGATPTDFVGRGRPVRLVVGDQTLVVKTLRRGGVTGRLLGASWSGEFAGPRRLLDAVALAQRLGDRGVATARPAFARIRRGALPGLCRLELATFELAGARDAASCFAARPEPKARRAMVVACAATVAAMHEAGVLHADLNLRNLLLSPGPRFDAWVIDLERSTQPRPLTPRDRVRNLERLLRSTEKLGLLGALVSRSDRLRFLAAYEPGARRELFAAVARRHGRRAPWHRIAWRLFGGREALTSPSGS